MKPYAKFLLERQMQLITFHQLLCMKRSMNKTTTIP